MQMWLRHSSSQPLRYKNKKYRAEEEDEREREGERNKDTMKARASESLVKYSAALPDCIVIWRCSKLFA